MFSLADINSLIVLFTAGKLDHFKASNILLTVVRGTYNSNSAIHPLMTNLDLSISYLHIFVSYETVYYKPAKLLL
jgi:hypothetical protein